MFYKQVLFITPIFWEGVFNGFSGLPIYEKYIYTMYNIFFTAIPIFWFAVMDTEYWKAKFLENPSFYIIGLQNLCFSKFIFLRWILYGVAHGALVFFICFESFEWQGGSYWLEGCFSYTSVVIIANIKVLNSTSDHTFFSLFICLGSIIFYLIVSVILNYIPSNDLFGVFDILIYSWEFWIGLAFMCFAVVNLDVGLNFISDRSKKHVIKMAKGLKDTITFKKLRDWRMESLAKRSLTWRS